MARMKTDMTKKQLIAKIKNELVWYAQPRQMALRSKTELMSVYQDAKKLNLLAKKRVKR